VQCTTINSTPLGAKRNTYIYFGFFMRCLKTESRFGLKYQTQDPPETRVLGEAEWPAKLWNARRKLVLLSHRSQINLVFWTRESARDGTEDDSLSKIDVEGCLELSRVRHYPRPPKWCEVLFCILSVSHHGSIFACCPVTPVTSVPETHYPSQLRCMIQDITSAHRRLTATSNIPTKCCPFFQNIQKTNSQIR
jgi:hypothetical protein